MSSISILGDTSGSVLLQAPAVAGSTTLTLPATTGTLALASTIPAFSAYSNTSQSVTSSAYAKVLFDTEEFDTNNNFASSRFTPTVAGYYQLSTMVAWLSVSANVVFITLYKNGSVVKHLSRTPKTAQYIWMTGSTLVYANGTDYFEIYAYQDSGSTMTIDSGIGYTWFNGCLMRPA